MKNKAAVLLGKSKSKAKATSSKKNGKNWNKPHFKKCRHFEKVFPHPLIQSEWEYKFDLETLTPTGRKSTYNPDYFCPKTGYFIEVATSKPNISEQGEKWARAIKLGLKLKVYWWEGNEITKDFKAK